MSSGPAGQNEILNQLFQGLKSKNPEMRQTSARDLRRYVRYLPELRGACRTKTSQVTAAIADMNSDSSTKLWDEHINRRLFDLIHSNNSTDKLGGILAIGAPSSLLACPLAS